MDDIAIINKTTGKVVATHQSHQNITIEEHYPPKSYGDCEIIALPDGVKVDYETMINPVPALKVDKQRESIIKTEMFKTKTTEITTALEKAETDLITAGKLTAIVAKK